MQENELKQLIAAITILVQPVVEESGLELVEVQYRSENIGWVLRLIIYRSEGVTLDDCKMVSRQVGYLLDIEDIISQKYHLEVSSPGLDRPLRKVKDYERNIGAKVKIKVCNSDGARTLTGEIIAVKGNEIVLAYENDREVFKISEINKSKLVIEI